MDTINGKKITATEQKFLSKLSTAEDDYSETITNPFSGESCVLNNLQESVYSYIKGAEMLGVYGKDFDTALNMFRKYWAKEYMILLD